eukprot:PhF_6_TR4182/c0_g1_i3/m.5620
MASRQPRKRAKEEEDLQLISLVVGDWSGDGHGQTHTIYVKCNCSSQDLQSAFQKGCTKLNFQFQKVIASEYEKSTITKAQVKLLLDGGVAYAKEILHCIELNRCDIYSLEMDSYINLWIEIAKIGEPSLIVSKSDVQTVVIGGYGLFSL